MPFTLKIKYDYSNTDYVIMDMILKKKPGRHQARTHFPVKAYNSKIPIDTLKLQYLLYLCNKGLIPSMYHNFFKSL